MSVPFSFELVAPPLAIWSNTSVSWSPRKIEMIAGGASLAPRRWSLVAEATDAAQQAAVLVHGADHRGAEHQELRVVVRGVAGEQQVALGRVAEREVDVLARAVDAGERLLVEQALHAVLLGHPLERDHQQLLVVGGDVGRSNIGAISNWPGATSLWRVLAGMPSLNSSRSASSMNASTRSGMAPK